MKLGRLGIWYSTDKLDGSQLRDFVRTVENNGYSALWYPESRGYESMSLAACLLSSSEKLTIGSSIANIYARDSFTAQRAMVSLNALYGGRFILGLGVSHIPMVEGVRGHRYEKPLAAMSAYLDGINKSAPPGELPPVVVAALGPKMLALSGAKSRGAVPYNVTNCRVTWCCRIIATAGSVRALPRLSWPTAAVTGSSMRWYSGVTPRRSGAACGRTSRPAPRMSV
jgi:probable F420-dependent oxidoreductase